MGGNFFMQKKDRHNIIIDLINREQITNQEDLGRKLAASGCVVTQASVSRDLEELGIAKVNGSYQLPRVPVAAMELGLKSLDTAGDHMVVGKCDSGLASAITVRIDGAVIDEIVGTIAGDDTIFIAVRDRLAQAAAIRKIWGLFVH
jgi:transcriptional regulator of arginine metabolism